MLNAFRVEEFIKVYTVEVSIVVGISSSSSSGYYRPNSDIRHDSFIFKLDKWFCLSRSDSGRAMRVQAATTTVLGIILLPCLRRMFSFFFGQCVRCLVFINIVTFLDSHIDNDGSSTQRHTRVPLSFPPVGGQMPTISHDVNTWVERHKLVELLGKQVAALIVVQHNNKQDMTI